MKLYDIFRFAVATILFYIYSVFILKQSKLSQFIDIDYLLIISQSLIFFLSILFIFYPILLLSITVSFFYFFINDDIRSFYIINSFLIAFLIKKFSLHIFTGIAVLLCSLFIFSYSIRYDITETKYLDRLGFGFYSPNFLQYLLLVSVIFLGRKYWGIYFLSFVVVINTLLSYFTKSLSVLIIIYLIFIFSFFQIHLARIRLSTYYLIFLFFSLFLPIIYNIVEFSYSIPLNLDERLYYGYQAILNFSIIPYTKYYLVDNYYLNVISIYGIFFGFALHYILSRSLITNLNFLLIPLCLYLIFNNSGSSIDFILIFFLSFILQDSYFKFFKFPPRSLF